MNQNPIKRAFQPIKDIIIGGVVFLVPVVIIVVIVGEAINIMLELGKPLGALIPVDSAGGLFWPTYWPCSRLSSCVLLPD